MRFGLNQDRKLVHFFSSGWMSPLARLLLQRALCDIVGGKGMQRAANKSVQFSFFLGGAAKISPSHRD